MNKTRYTVVGYYDDNNQPFVLQVDASDPNAAVVAARRKTDAPLDAVVVEVFKGWIKGTLGNENTTRMTIKTKEPK